MRSLRLRRPTAGTTIAFVALIAALSGTAIALPGKNTVDSSDIKSRQVKNADLASNAVTSGKVRNRSLLERDFKSGQLPAGAKGAKGDTGAPGPFPDGNLPPGKTLRGTYSIGGRQAVAGEYMNTAVSFEFQLAAEPIEHFVTAGAAAPAECPGSAADPQAQAGHLCVYEGVAGNRVGPRVFDPTIGTGNATTRWGFGIDLTGGASLVANVLSYGTWAVTSS